MRTFWANGYESTSLADLMAATGLHKGSLYQTFGDKRSLFLKALKRYLDDMMSQELAIFRNAATPLDALKESAHALVEMNGDSPDCPMGCLAVNTLVEMAPHDEEIQKILGDHVSGMRKVIQQTFADAQAAGQVRSDQSPELMTSLMMTFVAGLSTNIKGLIDTSQAHELVDAQLNSFLA